MQTYKQMMEAYRIADKKTASELHHAYYCQYISSNLIKIVVNRIGYQNIIQSKDKYFNDIPLKYFEQLHLTISSLTKQKRQELGEFNSLAISVVIAKTVCKQIRDKVINPEIES